MPDWKNEVDQFLDISKISQDDFDRMVSGVTREEAASPTQCTPGTAHKVLLVAARIRFGLPTNRAGDSQA